MPELRKFKLTGHATAFMRGGIFQFRVRFDKPGSSGGRRLCGLDKCPVLEIGPGGVVGTSNAFAAHCLEQFVVPNKTFRNGVNRAPDGTRMFDDVTATGQPVDLNLDPIFAGITP